MKFFIKMIDDLLGLNLNGAQDLGEPEIILSDARYLPMKEIIESNLRGPIIDAPGTVSLGSGGPMRGNILRGQAARVLREKNFTRDEIRAAFRRFDEERRAMRKSA